MRILRKIGFSLALLCAFYACRKSTVASWDVDVVLPVVQGQLNIKNFFGDSIFKTDNNGLLSLAVTRTITAIKLDSLVKLPDTTLVSNFNNPGFNYTLVPLEYVPPALLQPSDLTFSVSNGAEIEFIHIRSGKLKVTYSNGLSEPLKLSYVVPNASRGGQIFTIRDSIPPGTNSLIKEYDMSGYAFNLKTGNLYNTIKQTYSLQNVGTNSVLVPFGAGVKAEITYSKIIPEYVEGYFGKHSIDIAVDTSRLDIIKSFAASNFQLSDASLVFKILNEFGCEFTGNLFNIKSINGSSLVPLNTTQLSNLNINSATKSGQLIYPSVRTTSLISGNSNIVPFLSNLPDKLTYQGNIKVNPLGNLSGYNDFAFYNTGIKVLADINIPLRFKADQFKLISNTKIDFANVTQLDNVNYGDFVITAKNGYPFSAKLQAFLLDANGVVIDSLFVNGSNTLSRGSLNNQNEVTSVTSTTLRIPLDEDKINSLKKSDQIRLETYFIMPPNPPDIKIFEHYTIDIGIVAELNYRAKRK